MSIRWRRGFFRLWVLFAAVWLLVVGFFTVLGFNSPSIGGYYAFIEGYGDNPYEYGHQNFSYARDAEQLGKMHRIDSPQTSSIVFYLKHTDGVPWHYSASVADHYEKVAQPFYDQKATASRWQVVLYGLIWAVLVPAIVLSIGSAIAWALSGFFGRQAT